MYVFAIVIGILLAIFGGGGTLIMAGIAISEPQSMANDLGFYLTILLPLGILPLVGGILLVRWGVRNDRARRNARPPDGSQ